MSKKFRSGVLHGQEVTDLLNYANKNDFALPAVNVIGTDSVNAVLETARDLNSLQSPVGKSTPRSARSHDRHYACSITG